MLPGGPGALWQERAQPSVWLLMVEARGVVAPTVAGHNGKSPVPTCRLKGALPGLLQAAPRGLLCPSEPLASSTGPPGPGGGKDGRTGMLASQVLTWAAAWECDRSWLGKLQAWPLAGPGKAHRVLAAVPGAGLCPLPVTNLVTASMCTGEEAEFRGQEGHSGLTTTDQNLAACTRCPEIRGSRGGAPRATGSQAKGHAHSCDRSLWPEGEGRAGRQVGALLRPTPRQGEPGPNRGGRAGRSMKCAEQGRRLEPASLSLACALEAGATR